MTHCKAGSSVCEASSRVFFCEGERGLSWLRASCYLRLSADNQKDKKNSSRKAEGINALCLAIGRFIAVSLGGGIDSQKEIDMWLLHGYSFTVVTF